MLKIPHCLNSRFTDGAQKVVRLAAFCTGCALYSWYSFLLEANSTQGHSASAIYATSEGRGYKKMQKCQLSLVPIRVFLNFRQLRTVDWILQSFFWNVCRQLQFVECCLWSATHLLLNRSIMDEIKCRVNWGIFERKCVARKMFHNFLVNPNHPSFRKSPHSN
jgi:hypothetical protein